eukprot:6336000-Prymnesium_polylepis.1
MLPADVPPTPLEEATSAALSDVAEELASMAAQVDEKVDHLIQQLAANASDWSGSAEYSLEGNATMFVWQGSITGSAVDLGGSATISIASGDAAGVQNGAMHMVVAT